MKRRFGTSRPKRYPTPVDTGWLTTRQIADQMGWKYKKAAHILVRFRMVLPAPQRACIGSLVARRWPASVVEDLRRLISLPHDEIDSQSDWLARYLKEGPHGQSGKRSADHR